MFAFTRSWEGSRVSYLAVAKPWKWLEHQKLRPSWAHWPQPWRWGCADRCTSARCPQTRWADPWCRSWRWQRPPTGYMGKFLLIHFAKNLNLKNGFKHSCSHTLSSMVSNLVRTMPSISLGLSVLEWSARAWLNFTYKYAENIHVLLTECEQ